MYFVIFIYFINSLSSEAMNMIYVVFGTGIVYLFYVSITLINEKKNKMIDYLRTMGLLV